MHTLMDIEKAGQGEDPTPEAIERQKREQDDIVIALRRMLAQTAREELLLFTAA